MEKIMVLGAGTMGAGIAQVLAQAGYEVFLRDIEERYVEAGLNKIDKNLSRLVKKEKIDENEKNTILNRIKGIVNISDGKEVDVVIEAAIENLEIKKQIFRELDEICKSTAIFASNTSSISITALAAATKRPDKFIGMHFFNPVPVMKLVEIIKGIATSEETVQVINKITKNIGKNPIFANEAPGFIVNRILVPMINEAAYLLMEGVAKKEEIDEAMKYGANHPIGPLALADLIGLDVCLSVMEVLHYEFGEDKYRPCPLLRKMVRAGFLGRKTNKGFYTYE